MNFREWVRGKKDTDEDIQKAKKGVEATYKFRGAGQGAVATTQVGIAVASLIAGAVVGPFLAVAGVNAALSARSWMNAKKLSEMSVDEIKEYADVMKKENNKQSDIT